MPVYEEFVEKPRKFEGGGKRKALLYGRGVNDVDYAVYATGINYKGK